MTFREYYQKLKSHPRPPHPARAFILEVAERTGRSPKTISNWISGMQDPPVEIRAELSEWLGMEEKELFPML